MRCVCRLAAMVAQLSATLRSRDSFDRYVYQQGNQQSLPHLSADRLAVRTEESEADDMMTMKSSSQMDCPSIV